MAAKKQKFNPVKCSAADSYVGRFEPRCNNYNPCEVCRLKYQVQQKHRELQELKDAVQAVYYAAAWVPDREVPFAANKWARLRDAAGFPHGQSPVPREGYLGLDLEEFKRRMLACAAGVVQTMSGKAVKRINVEYHD